MPSQRGNLPPSFASLSLGSPSYSGPPRNVSAIAELQFAENLRPEKYEMLGTQRDSKILFLDVHILDSTGKDPYRGDVLVEHERFTQVGKVDNIEELKARAIQGGFESRLWTLADQTAREIRRSASSPVGAAH